MMPSGKLPLHQKGYKWQGLPAPHGIGYGLGQIAGPSAQVEFCTGFGP